MHVNRTTRVVDGLDFDDIDFAGLIEQNQPCIVRGALKQTPLVVAGKRSAQAAMAHLLTYESGRPLLSFSADATAKGRFFYRDAMDGFNFSTGHSSVPEFFACIEQGIASQSQDTFYAGSIELADQFPGLLEAESLQLPGSTFDEYSPSIGIWMGNRTTAATHFDVSNNIAACLVGRRRFTLFPPDQIRNLYPGPLEPTPAGQVVSMVDLNAPDCKRYPRARLAMEAGEVADLEPGDVLVYPAMWWHQVEARDDFNVMINYWWNPVPAFVDDPMNTLWHALLSLRDRPAAEKDAWRELFEFYVFGDADAARAHLPEAVHGPVAPLNDVLARRLRAKLQKKFNR